MKRVEVERLLERTIDPRSVFFGNAKVERLARFAMEAMEQVAQGDGHYHPWHINVIEGCAKCALLAEWEAK